MITELSTVKGRLGIDQYDVQYDGLLTNAIKAVGERFDRICNRKLGRMVDAVEEFEGNELEIAVRRYPIEVVSKFELKRDEVEGWVEQAGVGYVVRTGCVISLKERLGDEWRVGRVTYSGGYVLPGDTVGASQTKLPDDLEQAAVEQVAAWFTNREKLGLVRRWPKGGVYEEFVQAEMLVGVREVLRGYERVGRG